MSVLLMLAMVLPEELPEPQQEASKVVKDSQEFGVSWDAEGRLKRPVGMSSFVHLYELSRAEVIEELKIDDSQWRSISASVRDYFVRSTAVARKLTPSEAFFKDKSDQEAKRLRLKQGGYYCGWAVKEQRKTLEVVLSPVQLQRFDQILLQRRLAMQGAATTFRARDIRKKLSLTDAQVERMSSFRRKAVGIWGEMPPSEVMAVWHKNATEEYQHCVGFLRAEQVKAWTGLIGEDARIAGLSGKCLGLEIAQPRK